MELESGLSLSVSFLVLDQHDPNAAKVDGTAGTVSIQNAAIRNYRLSERTVLRIGRGELPFMMLETPKIESLAGDITAADYSRFSPLNLLFYLRGNGAITVEINGERFTVDDSARTHLQDVIEETIRQRELYGYDRSR